MAYYSLHDAHRVLVIILPTGWNTDPDPCTDRLDFKALLTTPQKDFCTLNSAQTVQIYRGLGKQGAIAMRVS